MRHGSDPVQFVTQHDSVEHDASGVYRLVCFSGQQIVPVFSATSKNKAQHSFFGSSTCLQFRKFRSCEVLEVEFVALCIGCKTCCSVGGGL